LNAAFMARPAGEWGRHQPDAARKLHLVEDDEAGNELPVAQDERVP
jgi:hypothetical protein